MEKMLRKVRNNLLKIRCRLIQATQTSIWPDTSNGYLTIYFDYEGDYALPSRERAEASVYGVKRILEICKKHNIKATFNTVGKLFYDHPDIIRQIIVDGHDLASHSFKHDDISRLSSKEIDKDIKLTQEAFKSFGLELRGMRSPQNRWSFRQMDVLLENGLCWTAEGDGANIPYILRNKGKKTLVRFPVILDDYCYISEDFSADRMYGKMIESTAQISDAKIFGGIGFHPWVNGLDESRLETMNRFFEHIKSIPGLKIITFGEALDKINSCKSQKLINNA